MSAFESMVAERVASIPGAVAVTLGGSRADGTARPDSDWDFGLYYRDPIDPGDVRGLGWSGEVTEIGGWGGGVMNGGAWLVVEGRRVDLIYRDLAEVTHWVAAAERGEFAIERLLFYLAGIPTYVVAAELALGRVLVGDLPRPVFPAALRETAPRRWRAEALLTLDYAERHTDPVARAGLVAQAVMMVAHARLAAAGEWVLNEKRMVQRAGLQGLAEHLGDTPGTPRAAIEQVRQQV